MPEEETPDLDPQSTPPPEDISPETPETPPESPPAGQDSDSEWVSIRDAATNAGLDLSQYESDGEALNFLINQTTEAQRASQQLQQYQQLLASQQQAPAAPPEKELPLEDQLYQAPEYDPTWLSQVVETENGWDVKPGGDPAVLNKLREWARFSQDQQTRLLQNPYKFMKPYLDKYVEEKVQSRLNDYDLVSREQQSAHSILDDNKEWLLRTDEATGRRVLTDEGKIYSDTIARLGKNRPASEQHEIGMLAVERHRASASAQEDKAVAEHQRKKQESVAQNRQPNAGGTVQPGETQNPGLSLEQLLKERMKEAKITDEDIANVY